jgi:GT2 family glycosyltransferase
MVLSFDPDIDLSIIIVSYNAKELLRKCLESISRFQQDLDFEVMVIDNHSDDGSTEMLKGKYSRVKLLQNQRNLGFAAACNQGILRSRGRFILLLNPDTEFTSGGITKMVEFLAAHSQVGICGPQMIDPKGEVLFSCRSFPSFLTAISSSQSVLNRFFSNNPLSKKYLLKDVDRSQEKEVDWVSGSSLLAKREVFEKIGLLDEIFFMYVEDVDFCYRAKKSGFLVYYFPQAIVVHQVGASTRRNRLSMQIEHHKSMYHFYRKHHHPNFLLRGVVFFSILIRLCFTIWSGLVVATKRGNLPKGRK